MSMITKRTFLLGASSAMVASPLVAKTGAQNGRVVITGNRGQIGSLLTPYFESKGFDVDGVDLVNGPDNDVADYNAEWTKRIAGAKAVIHLAVFNPALTPGVTEIDGVRRTNIRGTNNAIFLCATAGVPLIFTSSTWASPALYGNPNFPDAKFPINLYGMSKIVAEETGRYYADLGGLSFRVVRIGRYRDGRYGADTLTTPYGDWMRSIDVPPEKLCLTFSHLVEEPRPGFTIQDCVGPQ